MKKLFLITIVCILFLSTTFAQRVKLNIANTKETKCSYWVQSPISMDDDTEQPYQISPLTQNRTTTFNFKFKIPTRVTIYCSADTIDNVPTFAHTLFLSPGDDITVNADFKKPGYGIVVTGRGSNNNQYRYAKPKNIAKVQQFYGDTLPNRVIAAINKANSDGDTNFETYVKTYKPSPAYVKQRKYDAVYFALDTYFSFKENNKFKNPKAYKRNLDKWDGVQDSLFVAVAQALSKIKQDKQPEKKRKPGAEVSIDAHYIKLDFVLNNAGAAGSYYYNSFIGNFVGRLKEHLWEESDTNPVAFYKEWYNADTTSGRKMFFEDSENLLKEKIINRYFSGANAEYLYAELLKDSKEESEPKNLITIFNRFKTKYPNSPYIAVYKPYIASVAKKDNLPLTDKMVFAARDGRNLNNLNAVLALTKGKTVLVDMWGTWCGPCREEIYANNGPLRTHFKGKALDFLYIANYDEVQQKAWKKLIAYFQMEGTHILANEKLTKDIMSSVKGTGFPTYFIIKKDGSFETSTAGYPMNREKLIKQLEAALAM